MGSSLLEILTKNVLVATIMVIGVYFALITYLDIKKMELEIEKLRAIKNKPNKVLTEHKCDDDAPNNALLYHSDANKTLMEVYNEIYSDDTLIEGFDPLSETNNASNVTYSQNYTDISNTYINDKKKEQLKLAYEQLLPYKSQYYYKGSELDKANFVEPAYGSHTFKIDNFVYKNEQLQNGGMFFGNVSANDCSFGMYPCL